MTEDHRNDFKTAAIEAKNTSGDGFGTQSEEPAKDPKKEKVEGLLAKFDKIISEAKNY